MSITALIQNVGLASTLEGNVSILLLLFLDHGDARAASQAGNQDTQNMTNAQNCGRVHKATLPMPQDWALWEALVPCWMRSILDC